MIFTETYLKGSYIIDLEPFQDGRGWFARYFCKDEFIKIGHQKEWVQMNHSVTYKKGAVRGLHFQLSPYSEVKLVRCIKGSVQDIIVDLRQNSSSFLQYFSIELSAENRRSLYIPEGFAHGFQTLQPDTELLYHHSNYYKPGFEGGIRYNDPMLQIEWPLEVTEISERDLNHPYLTNSFKGIK